MLHPINSQIIWTTAFFKKKWSVNEIIFSLRFKANVKPGSSHNTLRYVTEHFTSSHFIFSSSSKKRRVDVVCATCPILWDNKVEHRITFHHHHRIAHYCYYLFNNFLYMFALLSAWFDCKRCLSLASLFPASTTCRHGMNRVELSQVKLSRIWVLLNDLY